MLQFSMKTSCKGLYQLRRLGSALSMVGLVSMVAVMRFMIYNKGIGQLESTDMLLCLPDRKKIDKSQFIIFIRFWWHLGDLFDWWTQPSLLLVEAPLHTYLLAHGIVALGPSGSPFARTFLGSQPRVTIHIILLDTLILLSFQPPSWQGLQNGLSFAERFRFRAEPLFLVIVLN